MKKKEIEINKLLNRQEKLFVLQKQELDDTIKKAIQVVIDLYFEKMERIERGEK